MIYKPEYGGMWDPSVFYYQGEYLMICMHKDEVTKADDCMYLARSKDGVFWKGDRDIVHTREDVFKGYIYTDGRRLLMNHGSSSTVPARDNDTLRFYQSEDTRTFEHLFDMHPDERWYLPTGRFDHMYVIPKDEDDYGKGAWGFPTATPIPAHSGAFGLMESDDFIHWRQLYPPEIVWGDVEPTKEFEILGCEKIEGRYCLTGGSCPPLAGNNMYACYQLWADKAEGPYVFDREKCVFAGASGLEGAVFISCPVTFARGDGELLFASVILPGDGFNVWMLPLKKAVYEDGAVRMAWWPSNEALKGAPIETGTMEPVIQTEVNPSGIQLVDSRMTRPFDFSYDPEEGVVLEVDFSVEVWPRREPGATRHSCWRPSQFGVVIDGEQPTVVALDLGDKKTRKSRIYRGRKGERLELTELDHSVEGTVSVRGVGEGAHTLRLLLRMTMFEVYLDDRHIQSYLVTGDQNGKLSLYLQNSRAQISDVRAWRFRSQPEATE